MRWAVSLLNCDYIRADDRRHIHRADFHRGLLQCATDLGIVVHLNSKVMKIEPYDGTVLTAGGKGFNGDLIVASDGRILHPSLVLSL